MNSDIENYDKRAACSHRSGCRHLTPRPSLVQRWMGDFLLQGLNFVLKKSEQPDVLMGELQCLNRWLCGVQTHYQKSGDFIWPYLHGGRGMPVVLLHGFGADKDRFGSLVPFLRRSFRVIIPDLPGFGDHAPNWSLCYDIDAQVERFEAFIQAIGLGRFHLMGLSLGGYLAGYYAARFPERVRSLALMDSAGFSAPIPSDAQRLFDSKRRNIFLYTDEQELLDLMDFLLYRSFRLPLTVQRYWTRQGLAQRLWREKLFADLMAGGIDRLDSLAGAIKAPTLVIWGADDRICHVSTVDRILSLIEDCRAYIIHGCGHIPMIEYPVLFRKIYMEFLREHKY
jgi:abhydrolase domain-containing protein 6